MTHFIFFSVIFLAKFLIQVSCNSNNDFNQETELTIHVQPGAKECFFQKANIGDVLEIEYQVVDMVALSNLNLGTNMHISFYLYSPHKQQLVAEYKKPDGVHRIEIKEEGDHELCFANDANRFSTMTVFFELYVDSKSDEGRWNDFDIPDAPTEMAHGEVYDSLMTSLNKVRDDLNQVNHFQDQKKATEARDRNIQEHNYTRVNNFSILTIFVVLVVGTVQVVMLKSMFEEKSHLNKIFKAISRSS